MLFMGSDMGVNSPLTEHNETRIQAAVVIVLVQGCIFPAAGRSACIVPKQAPWTEGGRFGKWKEKEECLSVCLSKIKLINYII